MQLVCCAIIKFMLYSTGCDRVKYNDWIKQIKCIEFQSGQTIMKHFEQFYANSRHLSPKCGSLFYQIRPQQAQAQVTAVGEQKGNPDRKTKTKGEQNTYHKVSFLVHYNETMLKFHFIVKNYLQTNETLSCFVLQPHLLILI